MSHPDRERIEIEEEESGPELRTLVKQDGGLNGMAINGSAAGARLRSQRMELAALGWDARRRRLRLK
jgi:hypothetical protein